MGNLLDILPERFANDPHAQVDDLMPWKEKMRSGFGFKGSLIGYPYSFILVIGSNS